MGPFLGRNYKAYMESLTPMTGHTNKDVFTDEVQVTLVGLGLRLEPWDEGSFDTAYCKSLVDSEVKFHVISVYTLFAPQVTLW